MTDSRRERVASLVEAVPDFPKPGILFRDITPLLATPSAFADAIRLLAEPYLDAKVDAVIGVESRGFMFAAPLALHLNAAFIPVRKPGKLPRRVDRREYALEYGTDALEMHADALRGRPRVVVVDDVIATGGTARAALELATLQGAQVIGAAFLIELTFLNGRELLEGLSVHSVLQY